MSDQKITPCLSFNGDAERAAQFTRKLHKIFEALFAKNI